MLSSQLPLGIQHVFAQLLPTLLQGGHVFVEPLVEVYREFLKSIHFGLHFLDLDDPLFIEVGLRGVGQSFIIIRFCDISSLSLFLLSTCWSQSCSACWLPLRCFLDHILDIAFDLLLKFFALLCKEFLILLADIIHYSLLDGLQFIIDAFIYLLNFLLFLLHPAGKGSHVLIDRHDDPAL